MGFNVKIWDMTENKSGEELKNEEIYNNYLEDVFKNFSLKTSKSN